MIKHIVIWKLKKEAGSHTSDQNARKAKADLEALNGKIKGLVKLEVGIDFSESEHSSDLVLYSEFEKKEDLEYYRLHPKHQSIIPFLKSIYLERRVVDYEV